ncbi:MAG: hypothetical protein NT062_31945 [Proteobacteria bacterium]|nr:hypothetical protein [Pseudomonadota bacterium]
MSEPELEQMARVLFAQLAERDKTDHAVVDRVVGAMIDHLRSWRSESVMPLTWGAPTEPIRDPRTVAP